MKKKREVHLNYFVGSFNSFVFLISNDEVKTIELGPSVPIKEAVNAMKRQFIDSRANEKLIVDFHRTSYALLGGRIEEREVRGQK